MAEKRNDGFETRMYQIELIEEIKKTNAILFLPTGSGKTFIALEMIKHMQKDLHKPVKEGGKRTIFLVNTVALVEQHFSFIKRHSSLNVIMMTGDLKVDYWDESDWKKVENDGQVLVMTAQIYVNALTHAYLFLKNANLIIFDECHHAVNKHPMREVMERFNECEEKYHPKVLGLSATLINANTSVNKFTFELKTLENTFRSKIVTSTRVSEVKRFSTKAKERHEALPQYACPPELLKKIDTLIEENKQIIKKLKLKESVDVPLSNSVLLNDAGENRSKLLINCLLDLKTHLEEFGVYFCYVGCTFYIIELYRKMFEKSNEEAFCNALLLMINVVKVMRKLLANEITKCGEIDKISTITETCSEKFKYLLKQLENLRPSDKCIVFVHRRMTAKILYKLIQISFEETKRDSVVDFMIGSSIHPLRKSREADFSKRCNKKVMSRFRDGKINILIASDVLEEGIDLPDCNFVFMYDFPKTFKSYVQSKGRARREDSSYVLFSENYDKCSMKIREYRMLEKELENVVQMYDISQDSDDDDKNVEDDEIYTTAAGATMTKTQAIPVINMYCSSLPHDVFTNPTPLWWKQQISELQWFCQLQLPMNAAVKEIIKGPVCSTIKGAKQSVAFEAVKMLHQMEVLNDNLMPILAPCKNKDEEFWFPNWDDSFQTGDGTRSQKREVSMKVPRYLEDCRPKPGETCYLHVINIQSEYSKPELRRRERCHRLLTSKYEFGIITRHRIPKVCDFPVFSDLGKVRISIDTNHSKFKLDKDQITAISKFHRILFLKAMQIVKKCLHFTENGYFLVPLLPNTQKTMEISWHVVHNQWEITDVIEPSEKERKEEKYTKEGYWGSVVVPWYRKFTSKIQYYVITDMDDYYNLQSKFPDDKFKTFADYYRKVYGLDSLRPCQPMMETRPIPLNMDCLRPRSTTTDRSEKTKAKEQSMFIAPEFVIKQNFPSCYWYKSTLLPTILHRLHYLLLAEEFREKIVVEGGIGELTWDKDGNDVISVSEKYDIKKMQNMPKSKAIERNSKDSSKPRYSRREEKIKKDEQCLALLLESGFPEDLDRSKTVSIASIKKFVNYIVKAMNFNCEDESNVQKAPTSKISEGFVINFVKPPSLMTLIKHDDYSGPRQKEIFEALTPAGCNDIVDLERLETLGDSFLKFAVSLTIFVKYNDVNEGYLSTLKGRLVGNRNLLYCGNKLNLGSYLKVNTFSAHCNWCPPGFGLPEMLRDNIRNMTSVSAIFHINIPFSEQYSGNLSPETIRNMKNDLLKFIDNDANLPETQKNENTALMFLGKQSVSDKTVADAVEALIGVYVKTGGIEPAYRLLNYFGILANTRYDEIIGSRLPSPKNPKSTLTYEDLVPNYRKLEELLCYEFRDKSYLVQAVTHPSFMRNNMTDCYQQLEFIGDAVLDFLITSYIFEYCGNLPPGKLTDLRASLVNNNTFGALAVRMGLHKFLLSNNKKLTEAINRFIDFQEPRNYEIHGNELMIMINENDIKVAEEIEIPKVLGDLFESLAGAIFLDSGNSLKTVWKTYYNIMKVEIEKFSKDIPINPIRALYEEPGLKVKFLKEKTDAEEDPLLRKFKGSKITIPLRVIKSGETYMYYGRGEKTDLCKRAAAKLALRDFGRTEFVI